MAGRKAFILFTIGIFLVTAFAYGDAEDNKEKSTVDLPKEIAGKDGAPMLLIPAGEFQMGSDDSSGDEKPVHTVYTDAFYMDKYEVTNAQYARFLNESRNIRDTHEKYGRKVRNSDRKILIYTDGNSPIEKVEDTFRPKAGYENYPVTVTWFGAAAYAHHYGKRLPTEAEWEKAARGELAGKKYPWGDAEPDGTQCNFADRNTSSGWQGEWSDRNADDGHAYTAPIGSYTPNGYGLYDMAGNVWEWCSDWYGYYPRSYVKNPVGSDSGTRRVLRGGSWNNIPDHLRVTYRYSRKPEKSTSYIGFRCARDAVLYRVRNVAPRTDAHTESNRIRLIVKEVQIERSRLTTFPTPAVNPYGERTVAVEDRDNYSRWLVVVDGVEGKEYDEIRAGTPILSHDRKRMWDYMVENTGGM